MKRIHQALRSCLFTSLLVFSSLASGAAIDNENKARISAIAEYLEPSTDLISPFLEQAEFKPPVSSDVWRSYPAVRKLEIAYRMAETAKAGHGKELLQAMAYNLALTFDTIRNHDDLKGFFPPDGEPPPLKFARGPPRPNAPKLSPELRHVISILAEYGEHAPAGGPQHILTEHFGLTFDAAYDLLNSSSSTQEAIVRGFAEVPENERIVKLKKLGNALAQDFDSILHDSRLKAFFAANPPDRGAGPMPGGGTTSSGGGPKPSTGGPAPPVRPPSGADRPMNGPAIPVSQVTQEYNRFVEESYTGGAGSSGGGASTGGGIGSGKSPVRASTSHSFASGSRPRIKFNMVARGVRGCHVWKRGYWPTRRKGKVGELDSPECRCRLG
jgi:hypothetical protein